MYRMLALLPALTLAACFDLACEEDEDAIDIGDLPAAVTDAIEAEYPGAELLEAEAEDDGLYEVEVETADGERLEIELQEDGTIVEVEVDDDDEGEDDCYDDDDDEDDDEEDDEEDDDE